MKNDFPDYKRGFVYQVYPASFKDGNGDGIGDLKGIIEELDYIKSLGAGYIWLNPIYESPMRDMGYDISDYEKVNPRFGTMADFDELLAEARKRDIGIIMDLVINHTSIDHPWFKSAIKDPHSPYRDYYILRKGKDGSYPNNWTQVIGGSAWGQVPGEDDTYFLHLFSESQPDLNYRNPAVIKAVEDIMRFWLDKGVAGFRCDMINVIYKESFADGDEKGFSGIGAEHYTNVDGVHRLLKRFQDDVISKYNGFLIGECSGCGISEANDYQKNGELNMLFQFETVLLDKKVFRIMAKPKDLKESIIKWQTGLDWNANYLENHDQLRSIGRFVDHRHKRLGAKMLLGLLLTLRGTPFIFEGEELGAEGYAKFKPEESSDIMLKNLMALLKAKKVSRLVRNLIGKHFNRDDSRIPMAFTPDPSTSYGFTRKGIEPWQKPNFGKSEKINVAAESEDPDSVLAFFRSLSSFREAHPELSYGSFEALKTKEEVLAFERAYGKASLTIVANLGKHKEKIGKALRRKLVKLQVLFSDATQSSYTLKPYEFRIYG